MCEVQSSSRAKQVCISRILHPKYRGQALVLIVGAPEHRVRLIFPAPHDLLPHRKGWSNDYITGRGGAVTYYLPGRGGIVLVIDRVSDSLSLLVVKMFF